MENEGLVLSTIDFDAKFKKIVEDTMIDKLAEGLFRAGAMLLADAIKIKPKAPHRMGALWRSQQVNRPDKTTGRVSVDAGFNIAYAAYQHEGQRAGGSHVVKNYSISRTERVPAETTEFGPKFLSKKLVANRLRYMQAVADYCLKD
jgi:hypothetical protein